MVRHLAFLRVALCAVSLVAWSAVRAQDSSETGHGGLAAPAVEVDPLGKGVGDFLDVDLSKLRAGALQAYQAGDYRECARRYLMLLRHNVDDAVSIYNLACCYGLMGEDSLAAGCLRRAFDAGFDDMGLVRRDHDFDRVRNTEVFSRAVEEMVTILQVRQADRGRILYLGISSLLPCRVRTPAEYDPEDTYPLVIALHGRGGEPSRFVSAGLGSLPSAFICAGLQAPYALPGAGSVGYGWWLRDPGEPRVRDTSLELTQEYVAKAAERLRAMYPVSKVYLLGFSEGGALAYNVGIRHHSLFDGVVCFGGWLDTEVIAEDQIAKAKDLRVFVAHGWEDPAVGFEAAVRAKDLLTGHGYDVTFHAFDGGHEVPDKVLNEVAGWLKNQG